MVSLPEPSSYAEAEHRAERDSMRERKGGRESKGCPAYSQWVWVLQLPWILHGAPAARIQTATMI